MIHATPPAPLPNVEATRGTTGLVIYRASRLEALLDPFRDLLAATWPDNPLVAQTVIAAHPGIKQWLTGALARRMGTGGIVANLDVVLPSTWLDRLATARLGAHAVALPRYQRAHLRWNLHEWLADPATVAGLDDPRIRPFLQPTGADDAERARRRYQLADRLAKLYSQYLVYRGDWLAAWQRGHFRMASAQAQEAALADTEARLLGPLWRKAAATLGPHRAEVIDALITSLQNDGAERAPLHVFGVSHLAPRELDTLRVYAERALVALYLPDPCRDYWGVLDHGGAGEWREEERRLMAAAGEGDWWRSQRHELLARWGRLGQHFFSAVADGGVREDTRHWRDLEDAAPGNRLQRVQASLRQLDEGLLKPGGDIDRELHDASLRAHACHTPKRELEVLRDAMLDARAVGIAPGDMLVMAPDITRYLPLIPAVFGPPGDVRAALPYHLADVPTSRTHPLFAAFERLLALPAARITAPEVLDLLSMPEVARRFGASPDALAALESLLVDSRVAWSLDPAHRAGLGVPAVSEHGFAWALDRMVAGHLFVDQVEDASRALALPDGIALLPLAGVEGEGARAMAALDGLLAVIDRVLALSRQSMPASAWAETLASVCEQAFRVDRLQRSDGDAWTALLQLVRGIAVETQKAGVDPVLHWAVVHERLQAGLAAIPERQPFLLGGATFCGMVPQRAIPFRFIAVLGLNDGAFPRHVNDGGLDLMARVRRIGDRDQRSDDRYLFLETLMSARDRLHLSWIGEGVNDGRPRTPAAPLAELLALLARADVQADAEADSRSGAEGASPRENESPRRTHAQTRAWQLAHPLQPFDQRYFDGHDPRLYTYDIRQVPLRKPEAQAVIQAPAATPAVAPVWRLDAVRLQDLRRYWRDPAAYLLEQHAQLKLDALAEARLGDTEPLDATLPAYAGVARRLFLQGFAAPGEPTPLDAAPDWLRLSGQLPSGQAAHSAWVHELAVLEAIQTAAQREGFAPVEIDAPAIDLALDIDGHPVRLQGRLRGVHARAEGGACVVGITVGNKGLKSPKEFGFEQRVPVFIDWLALRLTLPADQAVRVVLLCADEADPWAEALNAWDEGVQRGTRTLDEAQARLTRLVAWMLEAPQHPQRWFPRTSQAAVDARMKAQDSETVADKVQAAWFGSGGGRLGERDRAPGHAALLARDARFEADSAELQQLQTFAEDVAACLALGGDDARHGASP